MQMKYDIWRDIAKVGDENLVRDALRLACDKLDFMERRCKILDQIAKAASAFQEKMDEYEVDKTQLVYLPEFLEELGFKE